MPCSAPLRWLTAALVGTLLAIGCTSEEAEPDPPTASAAVPNAPPTTATLPPEDPTDLAARITLDLALQEQLVLTAAATGALIGGDPPMADAYAAAANSEAAAATAEAAGALGQDGSAELREALAVQVRVATAYLTARVAEDDEGQEEAIDEAEEAFADAAEALGADAENGGVGDLEELLFARVAALAEVLNAQAEDEQPDAYRLLRAAAAQGGVVAAALAGVPTGPERVVEDPGDLRVVLATLLGEHALLAGLATQAGIGARDQEFDAAAAALVEGNSVALANALGAAGGVDPAQAFLIAWNEHVEMIVEYTRAVAGGDPEQIAAQGEALEAVPGQLAPALEAVSTLPAEEAQPLLTSHVNTVRAMVDAQADGDPEDAVAALRQAAAAMRPLAEALATAAAPA